MRSQLIAAACLTFLTCDSIVALSKEETVSPKLAAARPADEESGKIVESGKKGSPIRIYVTPFYNSDGPKVAVGKYSEDLARASAETIRPLVERMKGEWSTLPVEVMYVASIRLYDLGLKDEAVYWFYSAQFRARLFRTVLAPQSVGGIGSEGFERVQAHTAFQQLVGEHVNGYAFGNLPMLEKTIRQVLSESKKIPQYKSIYPKLKYIPDEDWAKKNETTAAGLEELLKMIIEKADEIRAKRKEAGMDDPGREQAGQSAWPFDAAEARRRQEETAKALGRPVTLSNSIGMKLVLIPAGEFMMGSDESAEDAAAYFKKTYGPDFLTAEFFKYEHPQHRVRITKPFYIGMCHVTRGQFRQFVAAATYKTDAEKSEKPGAMGWELETKRIVINTKYSWQNAGFEQGDEHPVVNVSWNDATAFCQWLSRKEGKLYRLPSEAEWEYSCRAGTTTRYFSGDDPETLAKVANVADAAARAKFPEWKWAINANDGYAFTAPVGQFKPNAFGLYDMHGNADQWCADWHGDYHLISPIDDPTGPATGSRHVYRGGSWSSQVRYCRSADRLLRGTPDHRSSSLGFRVVRVE